MSTVFKHDEMCTTGNSQKALLVGASEVSSGFGSYRSTGYLGALHAASHLTKSIASARPGLVADYDFIILAYKRHRLHDNDLIP